MNTKDFIRLGIPLGEATRRATDFVSQFILSGGDKTKLEEELKAILANLTFFAEDPLRKELAKAIVNAPPPPRAEPVKYRQWGEALEQEAVMVNPMDLPPSNWRKPLMSYFIIESASS
jgi:hypothetical protein